MAPVELGPEVRLMPDSGLRARSAALVLAAALVAFGCSTPDTRTEQERAADRALADRVVAAWKADPYAYGEHVMVEANRGVVRLSGQVANESELHDLLRISAAVPGVRRVVDQLEIIDFGRAGRGR
jgi:osmotically-inducible protein OsmY